MKYSNTDSPGCIPKVFVEAWNNRDPEKLAALFDDDAEFVNVTGLWWHSREAIQKAHAYGLSTIFNRSTLRLVRTKVKYLQENIAVVQAKMRLTGQTPVGDVKAPGSETPSLRLSCIKKVSSGDLHRLRIQTSSLTWRLMCEMSRGPCSQWITGSGKMLIASDGIGRDNGRPYSSLSACL